MSGEDILKELVSINSQFPMENKVGLFIEKFLKEHGFSTKRDYVEGNRFNILAERGQGNEAILFYGHMDTVPLYGRWNSNPLRIKAHGDRLYGLGAHDMKGGCSAILESTKDTERYIKLLFCVDEENISKGAWSVVRKHKSWFRDVKVLISAEAGVSDKTEGGVNVITLGRRGRCVIVIEVFGLASHGAHPQKGLSALEQAAKIVLNIKNIETIKHKKLGRESIFIRSMKSNSTSLSLPEYAVLEFDVHIVDPDTSASAKTKIDRYVRELIESGVLDRRVRTRIYIKKRETPYLEPYVTPESNKHVKKIVMLAKQHSGKTPTVSYGLSVADENVFAHMFSMPVVTMGPSGGNEHSENEWISKQSLNQMTALFKDIIETV